MDLKDFVSITRNKKNNQTNLSIKKTKLKQCGFSEEDFLNLKINKDISKWA
jgi:hypothetical protein